MYIYINSQPFFDSVKIEIEIEKEKEKNKNDSYIDEESDG